MCVSLVKRKTGPLKKRYYAASGFVGRGLQSGEQFSNGTSFCNSVALLLETGNLIL